MLGFGKQTICVSFFSAVDRVLRKKVHQLEGSELKVTEMQAASRRSEETTGKVPFRYEYSGTCHLRFCFGRLPVL